MYCIYICALNIKGVEFHMHTHKTTPAPPWRHYHPPGECTLCTKPSDHQCLQSVPSDFVREKQLTRKEIIFYTVTPLPGSPPSTLSQDWSFSRPCPGCFPARSHSHLPACVYTLLKGRACVPVVYSLSQRLPRSSSFRAGYSPEEPGAPVPRAAVGRHPRWHGTARRHRL